MAENEAGLDKTEMLLIRTGYWLFIYRVSHKNVLSIFGMSMTCQ